MAGRKTVTPENRKPSGTKKDVVFATVVQKRREEIGLTQTDLAKRMGIPPQRISEMEAGTYPSSREKLIALAKALETTPNYLFGFEEQP